jgi:hypothetical protein
MNIYHVRRYGRSNTPHEGYDRYVLAADMSEISAAFPPYYGDDGGWQVIRVNPIHVSDALAELNAHREKHHAATQQTENQPAAKPQDPGVAGSGG